MSGVPLRPGIAAALLAAGLFGAGTPLAKLLLAGVDPWMLAGLVYLGSGAGLWIFRAVRGAPRASVPKADLPWLAGAVVAGGAAAPVLLMYGLTRMPASGASLLLNAEAAFTALLAWFVFRENFDRRVALGMLAIVAGATVLAWPQDVRFGDLWPSLAVLGACLCWGIDNNFTRKVSLADATWIACVKGLAAGTVNLVLAAALGAQWPAAVPAVGALILGFFAYGASLTLYVVGLRDLGTARTGAYFSVAPFFGAALAVPLLGEAPDSRLLAAGALMALGIWLHVTERHRHRHTHEAIEHEHEHEHEHDEHHRHVHEPAVPAGTTHVHSHRHEAMTHEHEHFPDAHHRHGHRTDEAGSI